MCAREREPLSLKNWGSLAGFASDRESRTIEFKAASLTKPVNDLTLPTSIDVPAKVIAAPLDRKEITLTFQTTYAHPLPDPSDPLPGPYFGYLVSNICNKTCISQIPQEKHINLKLYT
jgi:hypothetical protein